jgi:phage/plasmid-like protein (TIGR03299 family)
MSHEIETMAYAHDVPWHGLGNRVEESTTIEEMLQAAGLDWEVRQHPCYAEIDGTKVNVGRQALVRSTDNQVLTITGDRWKPLQNRDALEFFREYCEAGGATLETAGSLRSGKVIWGLARVATGFTINGNDHTKGYILLVSPHEVGKAITVRTTAVRVVCANTLALAEREVTEYRQSHIRDFDVDAARATVEMVKEGIANMEVEAKILNKLKLSEFDTVRLLANIFQPSADKGDARITQLMEDPTLQNAKLQGALWANDNAAGATPGNGWGVLNGVTFWADHMAGRSNDARLYNAWMGENQKKKEQVKQALLQMAA